jgi:thioesterase domain-containing protein/acyl carrier protein
LVVAADVANPQQMATALAAARQRFGTINGVIHTAGLPGGGMMQLKTPEAAARILVAKVQGTVVIDQIFKKAPLDFVVLCSSVESILGEFGQVDYAAANAFLDAYAQSQPASRRAISINWDAWQQVGMAVKTVNSSNNRAGVINLDTAILPREGIAAFDRLLSSGLSQVVVSTTDLPARIEKIQQSSVIAAAAAVAAVDTDQSLQFSNHPEITQLEKTIAQLWQQVLGMPDIGLEDNFFEIGGDSLVAVQILTKLSKVVGENIPLATFVQAPTIKQLAALLDRGEEALSWSSLVPIQPQGSKPPLFCVHALGGNVLDYFLLAQHLGPEQPFYGLQAVGLDGQQAPLRRVEDMASHYVQEILTLQPVGPYFLSGYSFGAMIAFEMAQQLSAQGHEIGLLAFLDGSSPLLPKTRPSAVRSLGIHLANLWQLTPAEQLTYIKGRLEYRQHQASLREALINQWSNNGVISQHLVDLLDGNLQAMDDYVGKTYPGNALLLRSRIQEMDSALVPDLSWSPLIAGNLDIKTIPGAHFSLMKEPNVRVVAELLKLYL